MSADAPSRQNYYCKKAMLGWRQWKKNTAYTSVEISTSHNNTFIEKYL